MMSKDHSAKAVKSAAESAKSSVRLQGDNQKQRESGHGSAPYGGGPSQSDAVPKGSPGTGKSGNHNSMDY